MLKVILIDELGSHVKSLCEGIYESGYGVAAILKDCSNLAEQLRVHSADLAVIYTDAPSPATLHVLSTLQKQYPCPVLMFANDGSEAAIRLAMRSGVSSYVVNGLSNERLSALARVVIASPGEANSN